ncbi:sulfite exporter TauE/SafE family protein [Thiorhodovibrio winogradskyi]|uniref:sulfite exporter TauE/SafE family protein n=1 Tax=Thiorhodovibrio winogradskyi TaxID=77007 RepID=UPI002E2E8927|nr:sulfite exporter TauE/SafE family protein [Thiorhodovibrio winogradskyi]
MPLLEIPGAQLAYMIAYLVVGAAAGLMAGLLGVGGGAIMVPALIFLFAHFQTASDWIPHQAVATSLATVIGTGLVATLAHQRRDGVRWDLFARLAPGIVLGAWLGAMVAAAIPAFWHSGCSGCLAPFCFTPGLGCGGRPPSRARRWARRAPVGCCQRPARASVRSRR